MWREVWSKGVSKIYADVLRKYQPNSIGKLDALMIILFAEEEEPWYGRPRKVDPFAELKRTKRYV